MNKRSHRLVFSRSLGICVAVAETVTSAGKSACGEGRSGATRTLAALGLAAASLASQAQGLPGGGAALTGYAPRQSAAAAATASTLPTGASVVKGSGTVTVTGADMTVNQASQRLVTDWQSFSIGANNSVRFVQPSSSSVALNRIVGDDASQIFGSLTANGHVYLENANGVYFAPGAQVSVGSLIATTLTMDLDRFMQGQIRMSGGNTSMGEVANAGSIVAAPGGHVVLAGPLVSNTGSIVTPGGTTALAAGNAVNIDPTGSGLLNISIPTAAVNARLAQSGTITADGGAVQLAAAATDAALRTVMQVDGVVRARSIESRDGQILLSGGSSGMVLVAGQLDASGAAGGRGGSIDVLGDRVGLVGQAHLDASGATGGGTVLVGGNRHGEGTEQNATNTYVGSGVVIDAGATGQGNGGKVVVWADGTTTYAGQINARGGANGGDGGQVEVSGKGTLDFAGGVDLRAPRGANGNLLLDPTSLVIGLVANVDGTPGDDLVGRTLTSGQYPGFGSQIKATTVAGLLATGDVTLAAQSSIDVAAPLTVAAGGSASTLSLSAPAITIDTSAPMTLNNASLVATASSSVTTNSVVTSQNSVTLQASLININAPISADSLNLLSGSISTNVINQDSGGAGTIATNALTIGAGSGFGRPDSANLNFSNNRIGRLDVTAGTADIRVANARGTPLVVSGQLTTGLTLVAVNTDVAQAAGPAGALGVFRGSVDVTTTGSGNVTLDNPANTFTGLVFNAAGNVDAVTSRALQAEGAAGGNVVLNAGGVFSMYNVISGQNVDITGAGFVDGGNGALSVPAAGRFTIRSTDFTQNDFGGPITFGTGAGQIGYRVYGGYTGTAPTSGNGFFTNQTGSLQNTLNSDNGPVSKVYDGTANFSYAQSGTTGFVFLQGQQRGTIVSGYSVTATGTFADKNAGVDKGLTVDVTNNTVATLPAGDVLYGLQWAGYTRAPGPHSPGAPGNAISQITPKAITSTGVDGVDRVYNGTRAVGVSIAGASLVGNIAGDRVALSAAGATGTLVDKNAGVNKPVVVAGLTLIGTDAGNYTVTDASAANATISQLGITSHGLTGVNRAYDGTTSVGVNGAGATLAGVLSGDTVGAVTSGAIGSVASKNVGTGKAVTVVGVGLSGADAGNYVVTDASGATVSITPKAITATGIDGVDRVYDATTNVLLNSSAAALTGTIAGDTVSVVATTATGTLSNKNVGVNKAVTVSGLTLAGADAGNYSVTDASGANATITARGITSHGVTGVNRTYDGTTTVAVSGTGATLTGVLGSDAVGVLTTGATGTVANKNVGTGKAVAVSGVTLNGADAANYTVTDASAATVAITPKAITATGIDGVDRVYDATTSVALNTSAAGLTGTIAGDNVNLLAAGATGALGNKNVGTNKAVGVSGLTLGGTDGANYTVSDASGATATITPRAVTSTGFTGVNRVYDGTTIVAVSGSGATITGVLGSDVVTVNAAGASGTTTDKNVGAGKSVAIGGVVLGGADGGNYTVSDASGATVAITPRAITSSGVTGVDRTYDGTTVVAVNASSATLSGTVAGDNVAVVASGASGTLGDKNAGVAKPITVAGLSLGGGDAANYTLSDASAATATITPLGVQATGIVAVNRADDGTTAVGLNTSRAGIAGILAGDSVGINASGAVGSVATPVPGEAKAVTVSGIALTGPDALDYSVLPIPLNASGNPLTVRILSVAQSNFDDLRFKEYLQAVADAQEPFRRAMLEALLSGFGKENIRKQLQRGLVFETGLAPPAVDIIEPAKAPPSCTAGAAELTCGK